MLSIYATASLEATLNQPLDPALRAHLDRHINLARQTGLADDAMHIVVIQPGDTERTIEDECGFSPVVDLEGRHSGEPGFVPSWDHLRNRGDHYELIEAIGNSGFPFILLIEQAECVWPELLTLCREYAA